MSALSHAGGIIVRVPAFGAAEGALEYDGGEEERVGENKRCELLLVSITRGMHYRARARLWRGGWAIAMARIIKVS